MLSITKELPMEDGCFRVFHENLKKENLTGENGLLFFDIETTGLSREKNRIYLIGLLFLSQNQGSFRQWMAEDAEEEISVLNAFFSYLEPFSHEAPPILVHFNGQRFDLPFVEYRRKHLGLPANGLSQLPVYDIYQHVKQAKKLLGLENCRQKTVEDFLGLEREDNFNGGELIPVFYRYCKHHEKKDEQALLLHNREDVLNMPKLSGIFSYIHFFHQAFRFIRFQESDYRGLEGNDKKELYIMYEGKDVSLPSPMTQKRGDCWLSGKGCSLTLRLPLEYEEYKYFFPDCQNYYYLPAEDQAIHKSVASFVDPKFRKKATAKTCYTKRKGWFFPAPPEGSQETIQPIFRKEYNSKNTYLCWEPRESGCLKNMAEFWEAYLKALL